MSKITISSGIAIRIALLAACVSGVSVSAAAPVRTTPLSKAAKPHTVVKVNHFTPPAAPSAQMPAFSAIPTEQEITRAQVFEEPLFPYGEPTTGPENRDLARSMVDYLQSGGGENVEPITNFLKEHPGTPWRGSLLANLGIVYRRTGYYTRALDALNEAWNLTKNAPAGGVHAIADRALGAYAELNSRLGRYETLEKLFAESEGRNLHGGTYQRVLNAKQGLWKMRHQPGKSFQCGPFALDRIIAFKNGGNDPFYQKLSDSESSTNGFSLTQVKELAGVVGLNMQMALRGESGEPVVPSVVHWKAGHYAALLKMESGRYLIEDPTFGSQQWISRRALDTESSGYFLIPDSPLPVGWRTVDEQEGGSVWGKGTTAENNPENFKPSDCQSPDCNPGHGMPVFSFHTMLVSLNINDIPVGYTPPVGPAIDFQLSYNQRDIFQPETFAYSNFGHNWTYNWMSYINENSNDVCAGTPVYISGGGQECYGSFSGTPLLTAQHVQSKAWLFKTSGTDPTYERRFPDGSVDVYGYRAGNSGKVFLTERRDPQGKSVTLTYDSNHDNLTSITDAINQVTTLTYGLSSPNDHLITRVADPFGSPGRHADFEYNTYGQLIKITDVMGLASQFEYGDGDFIQAMITPYGRTTFATGFDISGSTRIMWLEMTDPLGGRERLEYVDGPSSIPFAETNYPGSPGEFYNGYLNYRSSFYWNKQAMAAMALDTKDYSKAHITHWLHHRNSQISTNYVSGIKESEKLPLENRIFYKYAGQSAVYDLGTNARPSEIGRVLAVSGGTVTSQIYKYEYNDNDKVKKVTDPIGRETDYIYDTNNIDLLKVKQRDGGSSPDCSVSATTANCDLLAVFTYNGDHQPLTFKDASGRVTTLTYYTSGYKAGKLNTVANDLGETTTYSYDTNGYLTNITGPASGATLGIAYDGYGRVRTVTDSDSNVTTYDYDLLDRLTNITYPDSTTEQIGYTRLDAETFRDRQGRVSTVLHDALRRIVASRDPLGQTTTQQWSPTSGNLDKLIDPNGNATQWTYDLEGRVTRETRADASHTDYAYEATTSRLNTVTDAKSQTKTYSYFDDNRLKNITYSGSVTPKLNFTYDTAYNRVATMFTGNSTPFVTTTYAYNAIPTSTPSPKANGNGRLYTVDGPLGSDTITYAYDELGRVNNRRVNGTANEEALTFDNLGRITSKVNPLGTFGFLFNTPTGRLNELDFPNGVVTTYTYQNDVTVPNPDLRLTQIFAMGPEICTGFICSEAMPVSTHDYRYTKAGNISSWIRTDSESNVKTYDFKYDTADQLTDAKGSTYGTPFNYSAYNYDGSGNRISEQISDYTGLSTTLTGATYSTMNRLSSQQPGGPMRFAGTTNEPASVTVTKSGGTAVQSYPQWTGTFATFNWLAYGNNTVSVSAADLGLTLGSPNVTTHSYTVNVSGTSNSAYAYDDNGNMTYDGYRTFTWDAENRLLSITYESFAGTNESDFVYDGYGRRVEIIEKLNSSTTKDHIFIWCGSSICEERDSDGTTVLRQYFGDGIKDNGTKYFYHRDHLGSVREVTDLVGNIVARYDYDPYGRRVKIDGDYDAPNGFTGHFTHDPSGLVLTLYRAYDPNMGRWLSEDPIGLVGGTNFYHYVNNSPTMMLDPLGLDGVGHNYFYQSYNPDLYLTTENLINNSSGNVYIIGTHHTTPLWMGFWNLISIDPPTLKQIASLLQNEKKKGRYKTGMPVIFYSCTRGSPNHDAQDLANLIGAGVWANSKLLQGFPDGRPGAFVPYEMYLPDNYIGPPPPPSWNPWKLY